MQCKSTHHQLITMNGLQNDLCSLQHMCNVSMEWNRLYGFGYLGGIWELTIFDVFNPIIYRFRRCFDIAFKCNVIFEWWSNQLSSDIDNGMNWNENTKKCHTQFVSKRVHMKCEWNILMRIQKKKFACTIVVFDIPNFYWQTKISSR